MEKIVTVIVAVIFVFAVFVMVVAGFIKTNKNQKQ